MNEKTKLERFNELLQKAKDDHRIIGLVVIGGRGKGTFTKNSDYDIAIIATDKTFSGVKSGYKSEHNITDIRVWSLSEFRKHAAIGSGEEWDRYGFTHAKAQIDRTGEIQKLVDEKGILPKRSILPTAKIALGSYMNSLHRSIKNHRDGNPLASHFDACESLPWLLTFLFAIEGRMRPYNKFLAWELKNYPLKKLGIESKSFLRKVELIMKSGDVKTQKEFHKSAERLALKNGCAEVIKDWGGYYFG